MISYVSDFAVGIKASHVMTHWIICRRTPLVLILLLHQGRSMKRNLDTGIEVYDNKVKKKQSHTTNEKPNMYFDIFNKKKYFDP